MPLLILVDSSTIEFEPMIENTSRSQYIDSLKDQYLLVYK